MSDTPQGFEAMKGRLDEIVDEVSAEGISLDEALALYEEAVKLGLSACDVSEADILVAEDEPQDGTPEVAAEGRPAQDAPLPQDADDAGEGGRPAVAAPASQAPSGPAENGQA